MIRRCWTTARVYILQHFPPLYTLPPFVCVHADLVLGIAVPLTFGCFLFVPVMQTAFPSSAHRCRSPSYIPCSPSLASISTVLCTSLMYYTTLALAVYSASNVSGRSIAVANVVHPVLPVSVGRRVACGQNLATGRTDHMAVEDVALGIRGAARAPTGSRAVFERRSLPSSTRAFD